MAEQLNFGLLVLDPDAARKQAEQKQRRCLHCSNSFKSSGAGHRICSRCRSLEIFTSSPTEFFSNCAF